jgi:D-alanyl-D-alanine-carboxypeptidase/D-alanyl-D-alanine-endopeptidase
MNQRLSFSPRAQRLGFGAHAFKILGALSLGLCLLSPDRTFAAEVVGDWLGTLTVQSTPFREAIHIRKTAGGGYVGVSDSPDTASWDRPLGDILVGSDTLSFTIPATGAAYKGKWAPSASQWVGQWTWDGHALPLGLAHGVIPTAPVVPGLDGEWDGALSVGAGVSLRLAFHIGTGPHGTLATFDSVDQGAYGGPVSAVSRDGDHVRLEMSAVKATLDGRLVDDGRALASVFKQGALTAPLTLRRLPAGAPSPWPRPAGPPPALPPAHWTTSSDADIRKLLVARVDEQRQGVGIVVGVIDPSGRRVVAYGKRDPADPRPLDGDTEFEIGSITKVFTSLLLVDMVRRGEVALDDPAAKYLPPGVRLPEHGGKAITLQDLATHTSGLPRMPSNFTPKDPANPYADYTVRQLDQFISGYELTRDPGASWDYSNLGFGLLGHLLSRRAGLEYEALVKARVLAPLGMADTTITLTPDQAGRLAAGHDAALHRVSNWDLPTLAGAGALRSTANDLLTFLAAELGYADTPLKADMAKLLSLRRPTISPAMTQALGWEVVTTPAGDIVQHGGGTGGYHTFIAFDPGTRTGVVVLTNAETAMGGDDIARHILIGTSIAVLPPPQPRAAAPASSGAADFSGEWDVDGVIQSDGQVVARTRPHCVFQQAGERLSGTCKGPNGLGVATGTVSGKTVSWRWEETGVTPNAVSGTAAFDGTQGADAVVRGAMSFSALPGMTGTFVQHRP